MPSFTQTAINYLTECGMNQHMRDQVIVAFMNDETQQPIAGRQNENIDNYPPLAKSILINGLNRVADKWLEEHAPLAWYRGMFNGEALKAYLKEYPEKTNKNNEQ